MKEEELYKLKCHELLHDVDSIHEGQFTALRVPGGWIYSHWRAGNPNPVFVPFDNEFQPRT
jgi:hypothetical protein